MKNDIPRCGPQNLVDLGSYCQNLRRNSVPDVNNIVFKRINNATRVFLQEHHADRRYSKYLLKQFLTICIYSDTGSFGEPLLPTQD